MFTKWIKERKKNYNDNNNLNLFDAIKLSMWELISSEILYGY